MSTEPGDMAVELNAANAEFAELVDLLKWVELLHYKKGGRDMCWDKDSGTWEVWENMTGRTTDNNLYTGPSLAEALKALLKEE